MASKADRSGRRMPDRTLLTPVRVERTAAGLPALAAARVKPLIWAATRAI